MQWNVDKHYGETSTKGFNLVKSLEINTIRKAMGHKKIKWKNNNNGIQYTYKCLKTDYGYTFLYFCLL